MAISHELAKQLKDAGFPQENGSEYFVPSGIEYDNGYGEKKITDKDSLILNTDRVQSYYNDGIFYVGEYGNDNDLKYSINLLVRIPSLSELMEACGDKFNFLQRGNNNQWLSTGGPIIHNEGGPDWYKYVSEGSAPDEAVTKLYLALHK